MEENSPRVASLIQDIERDIKELNEEIRIMKIMIRQKKNDLRKLKMMLSTQK